MRIAERNPRPHCHEFIREKEAAFVQLFVNHDRAFGLRGENHRCAGHVGWKAGPRLAVEFREIRADVFDDLQFLIRWDNHVIPFDAERRVEFFQPNLNRLQIFRSGLPDAKL